MLVVQTTLASKKEAKKLARILLEKRLIACAQCSKIKSHYIWQDRLCEEKEYLLSLKTLKSCFSALKKELLALHPYEIPEIIAFEASHTNKAYYKWAQQNCTKF